MLGSSFFFFLIDERSPMKTVHSLRLHYALSTSFIYLNLTCFETTRSITEIEIVKMTDSEFLLKISFIYFIRTKRHTSEARSNFSPNVQTKAPSYYKIVLLRFLYFNASDGNFILQLPGKFYRIYNWPIFLLAGSWLRTITSDRIQPYTIIRRFLFEHVSVWWKSLI